MSKHRLFVSWSRAQAGQIAPILKTFFQDVLGINDIFLSKEIDSGRRWSDEIAQALDSCDAGLILVTDENKGAPWLNFEAGAISKRLANSNVVPLLWDISVGDIADTPLNQFQSKSFAKEDIHAVVQSFGKLWELPPEPIDRRFDAMWPALEGQLGNVPAASPKSEKALKIQDVYSLLQRIGSRIDGIESTIDSIEADVSETLLEQSEMRRTLPRDAVAELIPYVNQTGNKQYWRRLVEEANSNTKGLDHEPSVGDILGQALASSSPAIGDSVNHNAYGKGIIRSIKGNIAVVQFENGNVRGIDLSEL
ncbi:TIR domain-containing protein [uncultured Erythrobacter sp.]|uniref:TIR domain-containing protein n=1 Tax=uncultured Erythrobacter sp. TaxID=263913 RepID=UPI00262EDAB6|nr:TIR domain-containing protein [uncultured Erythrobacter sp.]